MKFKKGFTLLEIVVVIAIMGILTVIIIPSLNSARSRNRDMERVADIGTIQLGLLNYYAKYGFYPSSLLDDKLDIVDAALVDPNGDDYAYIPLKRNTASTKCTYFHLGATLESQTGQIDEADKFDSRVSGSTDMNNYVWCGYSGSGIAPPDFESNPKIYNYNVHP